MGKGKQDDDDVVERVMNGERICSEAERNTVMDAVAAYEHRVADKAESAQLMVDEENMRLTRRSTKSFWPPARPAATRR